MKTETETLPLHLQDAPNVPSKRIQMLDVVRGWSMFFIVGGDALLLALCACFPNFWGADLLQTQLRHVAWEGFTFYDAIFPTFLLISGAAFTYSWQSQSAKGYTFMNRWVRLTIRTVILIALGAIHNGALSLTSFADVRYASVLARIALGVYFAAIAYLLIPKSWRWLFLPLGLLAYAGLFEFCGGDAPYAMSGNWAAKIDQQFLPGQVYVGARNGLDPEGLVSTLGAVMTAYLGMLLADFLRTGVRFKEVWIAVAGGILLGIGFVGALWVPIIKNLWTSTYVCVAGGWTLLFCALMYWCTDHLKLTRWFYPITFFGTGALWFYMLPDVFDFRAAAWRLLSGVTCALSTDKAVHGLVCAAGALVLLWIVVWIFRKALR